MGVYYSDEVIAALRSPLVRLGLFLRCEGSTSDSGVCLWSGIQSREAGMQGIDIERWFSGAPGTVFADAYGRVFGVRAPGPAVDTYHGAGYLAQMPEIEHITSGKARDVTFSLAVPSPSPLDDVVEALPDIRGRRVNAGFMVFDSEWQPISDIIPVADLVASHLGFDMKAPTGITGAHTRTVRLVCANGDKRRSRGVPVLWSPAQWAPLHGGSTFLDFVHRYQQGHKVIWPNY